IDLALSGLASGFDWKSLVDQLVEVERTPQVRMYTEQQAILARKTAYDSVSTQLSVLKNRVDELNDDDLFDSRLASSSNEDTATVSAAAGTALGTYLFDIKQLATAAVQRGTSNIGSALSLSTDVSGVELATAPFSRAITAGTFTINGKQITVSTSDSLQDVFDAISTATSGDVTGTYDPLTDKISLTSASNATIVLGSATDTSNFLSVTRLSNNGTATVTSAAALGAVDLSSTLDDANLSTAISDGGSTGKFKINGVEITFDAETDTFSDVLTRINSSDAGVTASYRIAAHFLDAAALWTTGNEKLGDLVVVHHADVIDERRPRDALVRALATGAYQPIFADHHLVALARTAEATPLAARLRPVGVPPDVPRVSLEMGEGIELVGMQARPDAGRGQVRVTMIWRCVAVAQRDRRFGLTLGESRWGPFYFAHGAYPTNTWRIGEHYRDDVTLEASAGERSRITALRPVLLE
ncbi:MAG: hypothetical protein HUU22_18230, partial [Phycisphaerae bacterium]|nr:hypothetical protein [Phycisphaerae bacterium]